MLDKLRSTPFYQKLSESTSLPSLLFEGLWDTPKALILHWLQVITGKTILLITSDSHKNRLYQDLSFLQSEKTLLEFPSWETLPGEDVRPTKDLMGKRLDVLRILSLSKEPHIVLAPLQSVLQKVLTKEAISKLFFSLHTGEETLYEWVVEALTNLGYEKSKLVDDKGKFALRGGIIDLFPIDSSTPYRIEFFGDTVDQIRTFDPLSQKSIDKVDRITLSAADEYERIRTEPKLGTLFDYLPNTIVVFDDLLSLEDHLVRLKGQSGFKSDYFIDFSSLLALPLQKIFFSTASVETLSANVAHKPAGRSAISPITFEMFGSSIASHRHFHPFQTLHDYLDAEVIAPALVEKDLPCYCLYDNDREKEAFVKLFADRYPLVEGYLSSGVVMIDAPLAILPYTELSRREKIRRTQSRASYHTPMSDFHNIEPGDLVVHFHNGIGRFLGVDKEKNHLGQESEFFIIEYAENGKLYVPVSQSHLISRYIGTEEEAPKLHKIGTTVWQNTKARAQKAIIGYAKDLLHMQAERDLKGGFACPEDGPDTLAFAEAFPYTETEDQLKAIADIYGDLMSPAAMDRLLCGDVGYGKTEVAMRAAFKAVADGQKQVAVLVPTTVLAMQHYENFKERMALFPIKFAMVSRFQTAKENRKVIEEVREGKVDILVGTHRMISKDVSFPNLGLIVIDEEQRFGVRAKESLKKLKTGVDCLTMTATPIPRTLYLSLIGARKLSVIASPPQDRLPIKTILSERDDNVIKNALVRELSRDGQAYFIHNRVESIYKIAEDLQKLIPTARIAIVHGQMDADPIDEIFHAFKSGQLDILIATTIIENGIDIANANTILIDRADTFGISDLYQLRGRVGRWNKTAYAYFLTPQGRTLPEVSQKRLNALVETSGFGGGMKLAMKDLEIRGAGDILGTEQSGHVSSVGFHLYCKLLKKAIDAISNNENASFLETKIESTFDAKLPAIYIGDSSLRLEIYHRLGEVTTNKEADEIFAELRDRFGPPPTPVLWLYHLTRIRIFANKFHFTLLRFSLHTLIAERTLGKDVERKSLFLPPNPSPEQVEKLTIERLTTEFKLPQTMAR